MDRSTSAAFWRGLLDVLPFLLIVVPFAVLFGVVARDAGLNLFEAMSMSVLVIAGASQFTALALMQDHAPVLITVATALAVNLRMAMYSAALVPHVGKARLSTRALISYLMVDQAFAVAVTKYEETPNMTLPEKLAYYFGCMSMLAPLWYLFSLIGALVGQAIPAELSLDFAMPVCFIALTAPLLRSAPHVVAAIVSVLMALVFAWLPWNMGLLVAAALAMIAGAQTELYLNRKRAAQEVTV